MYVKERSTPIQLERAHRIDGNVERVSPKDRFVNLRFGKESGDYMVVYVPTNCFIHRDGRRLPLRDVQYCDNVCIWCHRHPTYGIPLAHELEIY
jgi:hypothetical protein